MILCIHVYWVHMYMNFCVQGSGKTMLMDMFFDSADVRLKQRSHFNAFMLDVHSSEHCSVFFPVLRMGKTRRR